MAGSLQDRQYLRVFHQTKGAGLRFTDRLVWAILVYRLHYQGGMTVAALARASGLSYKHGVRAGLTRLAAVGLVIHKDRRWYAVKPPEALQGWFCDKGGSGDWYKRLAYFRVYLPRKGTISILQAAVLGVLGSANIKLHRQTAAGLAALVGCDARTVAKALRGLCALGAVRMDGKKIVEVKPDPDLFREKKVKAGKHVPASGTAADQPRPQQAPPGVHAAQGAGPQTPPAASRAGQPVPGRAEAVRQRCDEEMAGQAQALRRALERLRATKAEIKEAVHLVAWGHLNPARVQSMLEHAVAKDQYGTPVRMFLHNLRGAAERGQKIFEATKPVPFRRTDDVHDPDFWFARVQMFEHEVEAVLRFPPEKVRQVGSSLVPHYDEDQEGKTLVERGDAAERKRLPYAELLARLRG
jgi:hypothetical protein